MSMESQVGQKSPNFLSPHVLGMTLLVKHDKTLRPSDIGVFCADAQMLQTQHETHLVEQLGLWLHKPSGCAVSPTRHAYRLASVNRYTRDSACEPSHACLRCPCMTL